jgi:hypothetical protein
MQLVSNALAQECAMGAVMVGYFMYYWCVSTGGFGASGGEREWSAHLGFLSLSFLSAARSLGFVPSRPRRGRQGDDPRAPLGALQLGAERRFEGGTREERESSLPSPPISPRQGRREGEEVSLLRSALPLLTAQEKEEEEPPELDDSRPKRVDRSRSFNPASSPRRRRRWRAPTHARSPDSVPPTNPQPKTTKPKTPGKPGSSRP